MTPLANRGLRGRTARALAVLAFAACVLLDLYGLSVVANAPHLGGQLRNVGGEVVAVGLDPNGPLAQSGVGEGDVLVSLAGREAPPAAFVNEPDQSPSWAAYEQVFSFNAFMMEQLARGPVQLAFQRGDERFNAELDPPAGGLLRAVLQSLPLQLVGWCFLVVAFLIWRKQQSEATLVNYLGGLGVFASLITASFITARDMALPAAGFALLTQVNYWTTQSAILTLHLGLVFPAPVGWLSQHKWVRGVPWALLFFQGLVHSVRALDNPVWTSSVLAPAALVGFVLIIVIRLWRCRQPMLRAQLQWVLVGTAAGFLPWVLLSALPLVLGADPIPARFTLLAAVVAPICVLFAIRRYRLLDVGSILDWVLVHALLVVGFLTAEVLLLSWLSGRFPEAAGTKPTAAIINALTLIVLYAPLRVRLMRLLSRLTGRGRTSLREAISYLFENIRETGNPIEAMERTLDKTLSPAETQWVQPGHRHDMVLAVLEGKEAVLGHELGPACPRDWEAAAIIPVRTSPGLSALVLSPREGWSWRRSELGLAASLVQSGELLIEIERLRREHTATQKAMVEQREQVLLEMHDGLGSELFGLSLLTRVPEGAEPDFYRSRIQDISSAVHDAMDSLRTGLTVLSSPPGAFAPSVLSLLLRAERTFAAAGIEMVMHIDDTVSDVQLQSKEIFGLLRSMQEALTNTARHSRCKKATVRITRRDGMLRIDIEDDGVGFQQDEVTTGHGLVNIRRRLQSLGGQFTLAATPEGTQVRLELGI